MKHFFLTLLFLACSTPLGLAQSAFLGVELAPEHEGIGAEIVRVERPSAASLLGLLEGDRVTALDSRAIARAQDLVAAIRERQPGDLVTVYVHRGQQALALVGILGRRPAPPLVEQPFIELPTIEWQPEIVIPWGEGLVPGSWYPGPIWDGDQAPWIGPKNTPSIEWDIIPPVQFEPITIPLDQPELESWKVWLELADPSADSRGQNAEAESACAAGSSEGSPDGSDGR